MKPLLTLLLAFFSMHLCAQYADNEFYLWDANNNPVSDQKHAKYFTVVNKISDTCWQWETYNLYGPMVALEQFKDHDGKLPHGSSFYYHSNGFVDSTGSFRNGVAEGDWHYYNNAGRITFEKKYSGGKVEKLKDFVKEEREKKDQSTEVADPNERESEFPGESKGWQNYLLKNLKYPDRAVNSNVTGEVVVQFVVNTKGKTEQIDIFRSLEFSLDREAARLIRDSPSWNPAFQFGKLVKSYKRQPIVFRLSSY